MTLEKYNFKGAKKFDILKRKNCIIEDSDYKTIKQPGN